MAFSCRCVDIYNKEQNSWRPRSEFFGAGAGAVRVELRELSPCTYSGEVLAGHDCSNWEPPELE